MPLDVSTMFTDNAEGRMASVVSCLYNANKLGGWDIFVWLEHTAFPSRQGALDQLARIQLA